MKARCVLRTSRAACGLALAVSVAWNAFAAPGTASREATGSAVSPVVAATPVTPSSTASILGAADTIATVDLAGTAAPSAPAPTAPSVSTSTCSEHLPEGKARPAMTEEFPSRGITGHVAWLSVRVTHGPGEKVLPGALELQTDSDGAKAIRGAGFLLPDPKGTARVQIKQTQKGALVESHVLIPVVPLPSKPGRKELTLPPLPIAMTRSSGEGITLCSKPHLVTVEDSVANQPDAKPRATLKPSRQRERWELLRNATYGGLVGLAAASLIALAVYYWRKRPKVVPPPPPPRPAWDVAMEALHDIRQSRLIEQGRLGVHLERVSHVLRRYLGGRYSFEGLESTSEEILDELRRLDLPRELFIDVRQFLTETDLVKFADVTPTESQCVWALDQAEGLVARTRPLTPVVESPTGSAEVAPAKTARVARGLEDPKAAESNSGGQDP